MQLNSQSLDLVQRNYKSILLRSPLEIFEMVQEASGTKTLKTLQHELERTLNDNKPDELEVTLRDIGLHIKQQKEERTRAYQRSQKEFDKARYDEILRKYKQAEEKSNMVRDQIIATISRNKNNEGTDMEKLLDKSSGLVPSDTLHIQLIEAYRGHTDALARVTLSTLDRKVAAKRLLVLRNECAPFIELFHREQEALLQQQGLCAEIEKELSSISGSNERKSELEKEVASLQDKINKKVEEMEKLATPKLNRCSFNYTPPEPDFDSKRVLGTIARLIDANPDCYLGLEDIAGDRLFDVVVDTDETRELLLQHGNVDPDITIVSVEEASESYLVPWIVTAAQEIGGVDNVGRASDFIKAEEPLRRVMSRIFGCTLLCREMILAITVCQSPRVNMPCITFEGDMWDPVGVMSGGAVEGGSVLLKLQILKQHEAELQMLKQELVAAQETLSKMKELLPKYQMMCKELESARSHLTELKMKLPDMEFLEAQVAEKTAIVERDKEAQHAATAKIVELEAMVKGNIGHTREFQTVEKASSEARLNARVHGDAWCNVLFEQESHRLESKVLQQTVESGQKKLAEAGAASAQLKPAPKKATANRKTAVESHRLESKVLQQTVESGQKKLAEAGAASAQLKPAPKKATANRKTAVNYKIYSSLWLAPLNLTD